MIAGLASTRPRTLTNGLQQQGVSHSVAQHVGSLPPVSSLFAAVLGTNPIKNLLAPSNTLSTLPRANQQTLTGNEFFPHLISGPFHHGLVLVFSVAAGLSVIAALASLLRGGPQERANSIQQKRRRMTLTQIDTVPALVVIDLQKGLAAVETVHAFGDIVGRAAQLAAAFRRRNFPVVLVNAAGVAPGRTDAQRFRPADFSPPPEWIELVPELGVEPTDFRLTKYRAGAFHDTGLHSYLKQREVTQVVVAGIATTMGVESTARAAHEHGYHVVFATDAMTDRDADTHRISVERIFPRIGECATTAEILAKLDPATAK
jgi:nicotinamidase-related amidase